MTPQQRALHAGSHDNIDSNNIHSQLGIQKEHTPLQTPEELLPGTRTVLMLPTKCPPCVLATKAKSLKLSLRSNISVDYSSKVSIYRGIDPGRGEGRG